jgi:hypothetical protein
MRSRPLRVPAALSVMAVHVTAVHAVRRNKRPRTSNRSISRPIVAGDANAEPGNRRSDSIEDGLFGPRRPRRQGEAARSPRFPRAREGFASGGRSGSPARSCAADAECEQRPVSLFGFRSARPGLPHAAPAIEHLQSCVIEGAARPGQEPFGRQGPLGNSCPESGFSRKKAPCSGKKFPCSERKSSLLWARKFPVNSPLTRRDKRPGLAGATPAEAPIRGFFRLSEAARGTSQSLSFQWLADNHQGLAIFSFYRIEIRANVPKERRWRLRIGAVSMGRKKFGSEF